MRNRRFYILAFIVLGLNLSSCAGLINWFKSQLKKPEVTFKSVDLRKLTLRNLDVDFEFYVKNINPFGINIDRIRIDLDIEGKNVLSSDYLHEQNISANKKSILKLPCRVKLLPTLKILVRVLEGQNDLAYKIKAILDVSTPVGNIEVPIRHRGRIENVRSKIPMEKSTIKETIMKKSII